MSTPDNPYFNQNQEVQLYDIPYVSPTGHSPKLSKQRFQARRMFSMIYGETLKLHKANRYPNQSFKLPSALGYTSTRFHKERRDAAMASLQKYKRFERKKSWWRGIENRIYSSLFEKSKWRALTSHPGFKRKFKEATEKELITYLKGAEQVTKYNGTHRIPYFLDLIVEHGVSFYDAVRMNYGVMSNLMYSKRKASRFNDRMLAKPKKEKRSRFSDRSQVPDSHVNINCNAIVS